MQADFSRLVFQPDKRYSSVLAQQGRVTLDSDINEQALIQQYLARTLALDLIGPHGGPQGALGFGIQYTRQGTALADLLISGGRYYVNGMLLESQRPQARTPVPDQPVPQQAPSTEPAAGPAEPAVWTYWDQPDAYRDRENDDDQLPPTFPFLVFLRAWEPVVTAIQDPEIRETALGPSLPDTTVRTRAAWQVLALPAAELGVTGSPGREELQAKFDEWVARAQPTSRLAARTERPAQGDDHPCLTPPESRYRGPENQLYRIEVHRGGTAGGQTPATFKWSRDNGSVALPVQSIAGTWVSLAFPARDGKLGLDVGDWVELGDDATLARGLPAPLLQVTEVDTELQRVRLSAEPADGVGHLAARHPFLRRWDHQASGVLGAPVEDEGALRIQEGGWLDLEDGVQVWFAAGASYRTGDYWLVPARTLTGEVEWPRDAGGQPLLREPHGVRYHHAPLAWVRGAAAGQTDDLRRVFAPLAKLG